MRSTVISLMKLLSLIAQNGSQATIWVAWIWKYRSITKVMRSQQSLEILSPISNEVFDVHSWVSTIQGQNSYIISPSLHWYFNWCWSTTKPSTNRIYTYSFTNHLSAIYSLINDQGKYCWYHYLMIQWINYSWVIMSN